MNKKFQRCRESFVCLNCGAEIVGNGYTNHCPYCLWSKHVDINPGDRAEHCAGQMQPIKVLLKHGKLIIQHRCLKCGIIRNIKASEGDNKDLLYPLLNA